MATNINRHIPPKPPNKGITTQKEEVKSFKENLVEGVQHSLTITEAPTIMDTTSKVQESFATLNCQMLIDDNTIQLTEEDQARIYQPWKYSLIIKLIGKKIQHHILKKKIQEAWKIIDNFPLIDLGADYYIAKLECEEHMIKVLNTGPWFIFGHFLSIQRWKPNFVATEIKSSLIAIWIRSPQLPTELYDGIILAKIENAIGKLLKVDACTSSTLRGRYARLCIELPLEVLVIPFIKIGHHKQIIQYEGENTLCKQCGRLGHVALKCFYAKTSLPPNHSMENTGVMLEEKSNDNAVNELAWQTVKFPKKKKDQ
ncbi:uncharacterized protein [Nicotiana sylvestris]|uniref:CCHC-type domain-containing protein n=2 Tax=Nicotiana TaxID=4085 RepID=A0A1S3YRY7_TOBAC|nr:PREDICTED: uncharacterized protein LOC104210511 [Nicotiana sylvestris]XP_016455004.1 PREDICTED: uncharacterized protein LOC107779157 [Nicotiana tabacum]